MPLSAAREATLQDTYAVKLGDRDALAALFDRHGDKLRRHLMSRTDDECMADEAAQEAWVRVARNMAGFDPTRGSFQAWLFTIGRNALFDMHKSAYRRRERLTAQMIDYDQASDDDTEKSAAQRMAAGRLAAELQSLPTKQCAVLIHRFWTGLSLAETAEEMKVSVTNVKVLQHRACRALAEQLDGETDLLAAFHATTGTTAVSGESSREVPR